MIKNIRDENNLKQFKRKQQELNGLPYQQDDDSSQQNENMGCLFHSCDQGISWMQISKQ